MNNLIKFLKLSVSDKLLLVQTCLLLPFFQCSVKLVPFRYLIKFFKLKVCESTSVTQSAGYLHDIDRIAWAIKCVECHFPRISGRCLAQALTARQLLHQRNVPCILCLGAKSDQMSNSLSAHAWLCCGDIVVTGGHHMEQFNKLTSFL